MSIAIGRGFRVLIVDSLRGGYVSVPDIEVGVLRDIAEVAVERVDEGANLSEAVAAADVVISWHHIALSRDVLGRMKRCVGVVRASVGYDNVDLAAAAEFGIPVANIPDYGTEEVADHTLALMLAGARKLYELDRHVRTGGWDWRVSVPMMRLRGTRLGIVGLGRVGMAVARRAQAFGIDVGFYDPYVPSGVEKSLALNRYEGLAKLLADVRIVSLHTPLTPQTHHLIGREEFSLMQPMSMLINTARGPLLDNTALAAELSSGRLGMACLDVVEGEPVIPAEICKSHRVILTPHAAFYSDESLPELRRKAAETAAVFLRGGIPRTTLSC